jgi:hypothetical protein
MKQESTISKINTQLIRTFATLDAWFDKVLDEGFDDAHEWNTLDVLQHLIISNHHVLDVLKGGFSDCINASNFVSGSEADKKFHTLRQLLRDQLFHCLCLLDELEDQQGETVDNAKEMNVCDTLWVITNHLSYHLEQLEGVELEYRE